MTTPPWAPHQLPDHTDVLVVGAGPTGLSLACALATRGVDVVVVDRAAEGSATPQQGLPPRPEHSSHRRPPPRGCLGVYCSVRSQGLVRVGDPVIALPRS